MTDDLPEGTGRHLVREWVDAGLVEKVRKLCVKHYGHHPSDNQFGEIIATFTAMLTGIITSSTIPLEHKLAVKSDVKSFMDDLFNRGWEPPQKGRPH